MKTVVFTDLDGTLLDSRTYSWKAATSALEALRTRDAGIVLASSKTFTEMEPLHQELRLVDPFIVENGGGIAVSVYSPLATPLLAVRNASHAVLGDKYFMVPLGTGYDELVLSLNEIAAEVGVELMGFSGMSDSKVASLTGLELQQATKARMRDYDEPFIIPLEAESIQKEIFHAAQARRLSVVQGGRFWHLVGHGGKERAVRTLLEVYKQTYPQLRTVGLGDSPNDFPFLELVDIPVVVGGIKNPTHLPPSLCHARKVGPGPEGWNEAVLEILSQLQEV
jgi:mannosyl-3-phosphoglycerate phosphatase